MSDLYGKIEIKNTIDAGVSQVLNFADIHKKSIVDLRNTPPRPPLAISIGLDPKDYKGVRYPLRFGTFGNISMIKGEEKSRKTWLKSLILGCIQGEKSYQFSGNIQGHELQDKYIIDLDSEQDDFDAWMVANRVPKMLGGVETPKYKENFITVKLREYNANERAGYLQWLFMESEYRNKLGVVSIDGFVDFVNDFNSLTECGAFTQSLMTYSTISKSHIMGILHLNPGQEKARGHLGTILQQKCETVTIIKDEGEYSSVRCQRGRGKRYETFALSVNDDRLPFEDTSKSHLIDKSW
jgi:hypothetical protein